VAAHNNRGSRQRHQKGFYPQSRGSHGARFDPTAVDFPLYGSQMDMEAVQVGPDTIGQIPGDEYIEDGSLGLSPFADSVRPVVISTGGSDSDGELLQEDGYELQQETGWTILGESGTPGDPGDLLPTLPDDDYPDGATLFNLTDNKIYRNVAGVWTRALDGADLIAESVTASAISAGAIGTVELSASAVIALVSNEGGTTVINPAGLTVTDGAITVENAIGTVIIDGSTLIFRILYNGTFTSVIPDDGTTFNQSEYESLPGLGTFAATPAHLTYLATGNTGADNQHLSYFHNYNASERWLSSTSGGATNQSVVYVWDQHQAFTRLSGSTCQVAVNSAIHQASGSSYTVYVRTYVLEQSAL
jgi:hypothetical protein